MTMHVTLVHIQVKPESVAAFVEATRKNHLNSVQEPGNRRFDVLQDPSDGTRFILYEAYVDEDAAKAHKETAHYHSWRAVVTDMMAEPRQGICYDGLFPKD